MFKTLRVLGCFVVVLVALMFSQAAWCQDTKAQTDAKNKISIAIIKLGAMIELNNSRILQLNRDAARFDEQMRQLRDQETALADMTKKAQDAAKQPKPKVKPAPKPEPKPEQNPAE